MSLGYEKAAGIGQSPDRAYSLGDVVQVMGQVRQAMESVIEGKRSSVDLALVVLLAEGHLLVEDVPGVGKTMLAKSLGRSIACSVRRVQFTPDLLPSDITGVSVFNQETRDFEFKPGGIFANIVVGDEINRASPKTQSALLESMEERQVSVDGTTIGSSRLSWWSQLRTRSRWKAPTRCLKPSGTVSWRESRWATRPRTPSSTCSNPMARATRSPLCNR